MTHAEGVVRSISWRDVCPWTLLFRLFRLSVSVQVLMLGLLGTSATSAGWWIADRWFLNEESRDNAAVRHFVEIVAMWPGETSQASLTAAPLAASSARREMLDGGRRVVDVPFASRIGPIVRRTPAYELIEPFRRSFVHRVTWRQLVFYLAGGFWTLFVWCMIGGAITRIGVVRLGRDERVGFRESLEFAGRKLASYLGAPLLPLVAILLLGLPLMIAGLLMRIDFGLLLVSLVWIPIALTGLVMALFALGLLLGFPLMWSTISTEGTDAFDAISRSYAYTFQRPLNYAIYVAVAGLLGTLGWLIVGIFCDTIILLVDWAISWGTGSSRFDEIRRAMTEDRGIATGLIAFTTGCVRAFLAAFAAGYFWVAAAGVYLLLRRDADQTEVDDVYLEEEDEAGYGLPTLSEDEAGVPGVTDVDASG